MNFPQFDEFQSGLLAEVVAMKNTKGKEYANSSDRFENFNRLAKQLELPRDKVLLVYLTKHLDAINYYTKTRNDSPSEPIRGRIVDAITYLTILAGMWAEDSGYLQDKK